MRLRALAGDGSHRELKINELWPHKGHLILKFAGVDAIPAAEALVGCELQVPVRERAALGPGWVYVSDLVGCAVFDRDREIGRVRAVQFGAGEAPLLIVGAESQGAEGKEYEIPFAEAYLRNTDLARKRIELALPEGMLEVNAPLSAEEKQQARRRGK